MYKHVVARDQHETDGAAELNAIAQRLREYAFGNKLDGEKLSHIVQDLVISHNARGEMLTQIRKATGLSDITHIVEIARRVEKLKADSDELQRLRTAKVTCEGDKNNAFANKENFKGDVFVNRPVEEAVASIKPRIKEVFDNAILSIAKSAGRKVIDVLFSRLVVDGKALYEHMSIFVNAENVVKGSELLRAFSIGVVTNLYMLNEQGKGRLDDLLIQEGFPYHITEGTKFYAVGKAADKRITVFVDNKQQTLVANYGDDWRGNAFKLRDALSISPVVALFMVKAAGKLEHVHSGIVDMQFFVTDGSRFTTMKS